MFIGLKRGIKDIEDKLLPVIAARNEVDFTRTDKILIVEDAEVVPSFITDVIAAWLGPESSSKRLEKKGAPEFER